MPSVGDVLTFQAPDQAPAYKPPGGTLVHTGLQPSRAPIIPSRSGFIWVTYHGGQNGTSLSFPPWTGGSFDGGPVASVLLDGFGDGTRFSGNAPSSDPFRHQFSSGNASARCIFRRSGFYAVWKFRLPTSGDQADFVDRYFRFGMYENNPPGGAPPGDPAGSFMEVFLNGSATPPADQQFIFRCSNDGGVNVASILLAAAALDTNYILEMWTLGNAGNIFASLNGGTPVELSGAFLPNPDVEMTRFMWSMAKNALLANVVIDMWLFDLISL